MPKKKKPSIVGILVQVIGTSIRWIIGSLIPAIIPAYQFFGGTVAMLDKIPVWVWFAPLGLYIVYVIGRTIHVYRKELSEYNLSKQKPSKRKINKANNNSVAMQDVSDSPVNNINKTNTTDNGGIAVQDSSIVNSFNNSSDPPEFYKPTKENLKHNIYICIDKFREQFREIKIRPTADERKVEIQKGREILKSTLDKYLSHAKRILNGTQIPELMIDLQKSFDLFVMNIDSYSYIRTLYFSYPKLSDPEAQKEKYKLEEIAKELDEKTTKIDFLINRLLQLCEDDK